MSRVRCGPGTKHMSLFPTEVAPYLVGTLCLAVPQLQAFPTSSVGTRLGFVPLLSTSKTGTGLTKVPNVGLGTPYEEEGWNVPHQFHAELSLAIKYTFQLTPSIFTPPHFRDSSVLTKNPRNQALIDLEGKVKHRHRHRAIIWGDSEPLYPLQA
ncbi:hypothetical protein HOLleu_01527 [Holothuria leucospilota]|uniref:Uncharacterized protein n=1 Tax=Holothuria leucospilota TaxID=206669 RepID=A0A9Q1CPH1_HOLLE|nr:hypothetical protein HOLleu_01527 [Holothuria leucospilota]